MSLLMSRCVYVPEDIVNGQISSDGLAVIAWIIARNKQKIDISSIKKRFKWGDVVWRRVSKELRDYKFLSSHHTKGGTEIHFDMEKISFSPEQQAYMEKHADA